MAIDEFCDLQPMPNVEDEIKKAELVLEASRNQDAIQTRPLLEMIELPEIDTGEISRILNTDLPSLSAEAEAKVRTHVEGLGSGGEQWIAEGMKRGPRGAEENCPFCGQSVKGLALIAHYRDYFSDSYTSLKQDVSDIIDTINNLHADGAHANFERAVRVLGEGRQLWTKYTDLPETSIDSETIVNKWTAAHKAVIECLEAKQAAPLERQSLGKIALDAIAIYDIHRKEIKDINSTLVASNKKIREVQRKAATTNAEQIAKELSRLKAIRKRHSPEIAPLCAGYLKEKADKATTQANRKKARQALDQYRLDVFPALQVGVNEYLTRFNAGFSLAKLTPTNTRVGSTCTYSVVINENSFAVAGGTVQPGKPSFRNTLSSGDRSALALALFFSSLDKNPNLGNTIVVIDDHRSLTTIYAVRNLAGQAGQVIVMSHNKRFLCSIWRGIDRKNCTPLEIVQNGDESTIQAWDVSQEAITEHDQRYNLLQQYADTQSATKKEVAEAIRPHLEGFLRVTCPGNFPPRKLLGPFAEECRQKLDGPDEILNKSMTQELQEIVENSNRFHHGGNPAWEAKEINATELLGFVEMTLAFCGPPNP